jgi:hypothetical protein
MCTSDAKLSPRNERNSLAAAELAHLPQRVEPLSPGLPSATQGERIERGYFAGRNATWSSKATPATGWNE